jgi:type VI protein secretion system component Hcp
MTNAYIVDYEMHHRDFEQDDPDIRERFALEYQNITLQHTEQSDDGSAGAEHEVELSDKGFGA